MTSWMECGCGGDVILHEAPNEERYGKKWRMLLAGKCKTCGRFYETVPFDQRLAFEAAKKECERIMEEERRRIQEQIDAEEKERISKLSPEEQLKALGPDKYPWFHVLVHFDSWGAVEEHHTALTMESAEELAKRLHGGSRTYRIERYHKLLKEGRVEVEA